MREIESYARAVGSLDTILEVRSEPIEFCLILSDIEDSLRTSGERSGKTCDVGSLAIIENE